MSDKDKELSDLLAEYDPETLREWVDKAEKKARDKRAPVEPLKQITTLIKKSTGKPVEIGNVVHDRQGRRYYIQSIGPRSMTCVSMCERKYISTASHHDFGCYMKGSSVHDEGYDGASKVKQQLREYWESSLIIKQ